MNRLKIFYRGIFILLITFLIGCGTISTKAQNKYNSPDQETTNSYFIKLPHTPENCLATLDKFSSDSPELLNKIEWGCLSGDHTGYIIVEGKNEVAALQVVPPSFRSQAKVEKVDQFTMAQIKSLHQQHN
jgi:hypothetical protein